MLLLRMVLLSAHLVPLQQVLIREKFVSLLVVSYLVLLVDELLRGITEIALLVSMIIVNLLIMKTFLGHCT